MQSDVLAVRGRRVLESGSIPALVLRGPAIAGWLYDERSDRPYQDSDLLVPFAQKDITTEILTEAGFRALDEGMDVSEREPHASTFLSTDGGALDLHWTLRGVGAAPGNVWQVLSTGRESIPLGDTTASIPGPDARTLIVALHAAQHQPTYRSHEDLARALARLPLESWQGAAELAGILKATAAFRAGTRQHRDGRALLRRLKLAGVDRDRYALRPLWLLRRLGPALRVYTRARRSERARRASQ